MTVEKTLEYSLKIYPSIFPTKWEVYVHWFLTYGNGMEWVNGELVGSDKYGEVSIGDAINKHFNFRLGKDYRKMLETDLTSSLDWLKEDIFSTLKWKERAEIFEPQEQKNVQISSKYSRIFNVPKNVKQDWRSAALKLIEWIENNPSFLSSEDRNLIKQIKL